MLQSRKRLRTPCEDEDAGLPQTKKFSTTGREAWELESTSSSSGVSSPEHASGNNSGVSSQDGADGLLTLADPSPCSPTGISDQSDPTSLGYEHINRILKEAHFCSLLHKGRVHVR